MLLTTASAQACSFLDFGCNAAKNKAEKTQKVISIIDAGRKSGWKNVRNEFSNREIAENRHLGFDPTNGGLINALKDVNDEHIEDLSDDSWNGVDDMIGTEEYVDKQIAKAKLSVGDLDKLLRGTGPRPQVSMPPLPLLMHLPARRQPLTALRKPPRSRPQG